MGQVYSSNKESANDAMVVLVPFFFSIAYVHMKEKYDIDWKSAVICMATMLAAKVCTDLFAVKKVTNSSSKSKELGNISSDASVGSAASASSSEDSVVVEKKAMAKPTDKRSVRALNFYGSYPKNTMTPWKNSRDEGREGDCVVDKETLATAKSFMDLPPDFRDVGTPDEWIPRDGRMVRLTGRHPFNAEPPVPDLEKTGFLTPGNLHIIRNHGSVPKLDWDTHMLSIGGPLATNKLELSMDELTKTFPTTEFPVSISCCGNRRKEINMIKQTIGFNWGNGACGTMIYKGVLLRDILERAGVDTTDVAGKHVEFIGTDDLGNKAGNPGPFPDEPWGEKVKYGTSLPLAKCLDPADEVMVAFMANGERLHPDRGYPIRLVIPGYIGGRMIKWLAKINIIPHESHSCYHYWDNKYLPPQVTSEIAAKDGWWYKQEYIINELSLNSVLTKPGHNDTINIAKNINNTMEIKGYAHSGGGRKVTRIEVSVDKGVTWDLADIIRNEAPNPYGKYWCWIWWTYQLPVSDLIVGDDSTKEIWCRAWDTSNSPQPEKPVWTLMGQSSNHIFRCFVHRQKNSAGEHVFRFEYPTQPGQQSGGWATRVVDKVRSAGYGPINLAEYDS